MCPCRQFSEEDRALAQSLAFLEYLPQFPVDAAPHRNRTNQGAYDGMMTVAKFFKDRLYSSAITRFGLLSSFNQPIGHATHGGDNHYEFALPRGIANNFDHFPDARSVAY